MSENTVSMNAVNQVLTAPEAAAAKGVHRNSVLKAIRKGLLLARKSGKTWLIDRRSLDRWNPGVSDHPAEPAAVTAPPAAPLLPEISEEERKARAESLLRLLDEWMADESGYDEETWPKLKEALDRDRPSYRKLFPDTE
jgi:excisionase family DNA binding protein